MRPLDPEFAMAQLAEEMWQELEAIERDFPTRPDGNLEYDRRLSEVGSMYLRFKAIQEGAMS